MVRPLDTRLHELEHGHFEQSRVPTIILDVDARAILAANAATERLLGLPHEQIIGRPASDFLAEEITDQALRRRGLRHAFTRTIRAVVTSDGPRTCEIMMTATAEDAVVYVEVFDLTDLLVDDVLERAAEQGMVDADRVFDALPVATLVVDLATRSITRINDTASSMFGATAQRLVGRPVRELTVTPDELEQLLQAVGRDEPGATRSAVMVFETDSGRIAVEVSAVGLVDTPSAVLHLVPATRQRPSRRAPRPRDPTGAASTEAGADSRRRRRRTQLACGAALTVLGLIVLVVGWWGGVDIVTRLAPDLASMKANTAVGFLLLGVALVSSGGAERSARSVTERGAYGALAVLGVATAFQYLVDVDLGIDELLADDIDMTATASPGRMGLNTALCFAAVGVGALLSGPRQSGARRSSGQLFLLASGALAFLPLVAYIYGASGSRGLASSTEMALHTAIAITVGTIGVLAPQVDRGIVAPLGAPLAGGRYARRFMPIGLGLIVASGLAAKGLTDREVLTDPDLELAFFALLVSMSLFVLILGVSRQNNLLDERAERARGDLAAVMAAFSDRHYRVDSSGIAREVTGTRSSEARPAAGLVPTAFSRRLTNALAVSRADGRVTELTFTPETGDGRRELRVAPLPSREVAVSIRDISELAAARDALAELTASLEGEVRARTAELEDTNQELERSNADLEQFAYLASHDLQEPLRMVSTFVEKLANSVGDDLDERTAKYVEFAVDGAERMSDLIDGLLQYSRAGRAHTSHDRIVLHDTLEAVLQTLRARIEEQSATINIADDLPVVFGDDVLVRQILQNLLGNALKFVDPDRAPHIAVDARRTGPMVEIGIADNGVGIAPEHRDQVFLMFRRLHSRASYSGTGIGLSLVQRLVESQGGRVWIDPEHGPHGTRFVFTLPATPRAPITHDDARTDS